MVVITWKVLTTWKVPTLFQATTLEALLFNPVVSNGLSHSKTFSSVILKYVQKKTKIKISNLPFISWVHVDQWGHLLDPLKHKFVFVPGMQNTKEVDV